MIKTDNKILSLLFGFLLIVTLAACTTTPSTPMTQNELWDVTILNAKVTHSWNNITRFAGAAFIVLDLKFHSTQSPESVTVPLGDVQLYGYNNFDARLLGLSKESDTKLTAEDVDLSEIASLYCEAQTFSEYGCAYNVSLPDGGLPDSSSLAKIDEALNLKQYPIWIMNLEAQGDTLYVTLAFDGRGGSEDLVFKFGDLPPVTFTAQD